VSGGIYWLASYPKSGNTWLRALLTNYLRDADEPADINDLDVSGAGFMSENFDEWLGIDSADLTPKQINHYRPLVYEQMATETSAPMFLKVHDAFEVNDEGQPIFSERATAGAIYLIRNPLDVAVSYAHHSDESPDKIIRLMRYDDTMLAGSGKGGGQLPQKLKSWSSHVCSWADAPDLNVRVFRYEDMIKETAEVFTEIVCFAGLEVDESRVRKAVEFSRFERLQAQEAARGFSEKQPTAKSFFRRGKTGAWREVLSDNQVSRIVNHHRTVMRRFGYLDSSDEILF
jgi:hypothetical protein